jgi:class 3 adenylate cyclase
MALETRFARGPAGSIPYRVDGEGAAQLMIVSDWRTPYGAPGRGAFDTFVGELARRGVTTVTMLDGVTGAGDAPSVDERARSAQRVARAMELQEATLLGAASGGPVATALARIGKDHFSRLILYDTFPSESADAWQPARSAPPSAAEGAMPPGVHDRTPELADLKELGEIANHLETAGAAAAWAKQFWDRLPHSDRKADKADKPGKDARVPKGLQPPVPPMTGAEGLDWIAEQARGQFPRGGGLAELLKNIASLEGGPQGIPQPPIRIPTLVLDAGASQGDGEHADLPGSALGMEVASRIDGARHRAIRGTSRWPWGEAHVASLLLEPAVTTALPLHEAAEAPAEPEERGERVLATVLFTDIVGSTERLTELGDAEWRKLLERHHRIVRREIARFDGREVDNAGDGFLASFSMPAPAVRCAAAVRDEVQELGLRIRGGLHTGECERVGDKLIGIAVHIGARIAGHAGADEILVSATVRDLVAGSGIRFEERDTVSLKGIPGDWLLYAVTAIG